MKANDQSRDPVLNWLQSKRSEMVETLRTLVEAESPSTDKAAVDRCGKLLADILRDAGGKVRVHRSARSGDHLQADFSLSAPQSGRHILLLGHMDTVWSIGTLKKMPFRIRNGRAYGPGVLDMKAGIVMAVFALRAMQEMGLRAAMPVTVLFTSDEEVGSKTSRTIVEGLTRKSRAALVLEPAFGKQGILKSGRKGVGDFTLHVTGISAHAGLEPEKGASAVSELCRQVAKIEALSDPKRGIAVNVGVVFGGTRSNVVPDEASARIDVRIERLGDMKRIEGALRRLRPMDRRTRLRIDGQFNRPPMERNAANLTLFEYARAAGRALGLQLAETSVGGASDGNFTSALGVPTLDGLGGVGEGAHATHEHIAIGELPRRAALLVHLIRELDG